MDKYQEFLERKRISAPPVGFDVASINGKLFDFQQDIARWALRRGRAAIWAGTGLGKTAMQLEWANHVATHANGNLLIFMGIGSEGYVALRNGRKFIGVELKRSYWEQACHNLAAAEESQQQSLFEGMEEREGEAA